MKSRVGLVSALALTLACVVLLSVPVLPTDEILSKDGLDSYKYMMMGLQGPQAHVASPFMYRILFPWLAFATGMEPLAFFRGVSLGSLVLMALGAWRIASFMQIDRTHVLFTFALAILTSVIKLCATAGYVTDLPLMAASMWAAYYFLRQWHVRLACLAAVMVLNRELSFLLVLPALLQTLQAYRGGALRTRLAVTRALVLLAPALMLLVATRAILGPPVQQLSVLDAWRSSAFPHLSYWTGITGRLGAWLFLLSALAITRRVRTLDSILFMFMGSAVIALLQTLLGTDTSRLGGTILPMAVMLSAAALAEMRVPWYGLGLLCLAQYLSFVMDFTDPALFEVVRSVIYVKYALAAGSMVCLFGVLLWVGWRSLAGTQALSRLGIWSAAK